MNDAYWFYIPARYATGEPLYTDIMWTLKQKECKKIQGIMIINNLIPWVRERDLNIQGEF